MPQLRRAGLADDVGGDLQRDPPIGKFPLAGKVNAAEGPAPSSSSSRKPRKVLHTGGKPVTARARGPPGSSPIGRGRGTARLVPVQLLATRTRRQGWRFAAASLVVFPVGGRGLRNVFRDLAPGSST